jgi:type IV pilus assembly protein PilB
MAKSTFAQQLKDWAGLSEDQVDKIQQEQSKKGSSFLAAALESGFISEHNYVEFLAQRLKLPAVDPSKLSIPESIMDLVPSSLRQKYRCVPFYQQGKRLLVAMADPEDILALDDIRFLTGLEPIVHVSAPGIIQNCLNTAKQEEEPEESFGELDDALADMAEEEVEFTGLEEAEDDTSTLEAASQAPVVKMVNLIIMEAIRKRASDIHIEPYEKSFRVRLRIDGVLQEMMSPPLRLKNAIISRLKIMSELNIAERRLPQDGRIKVRTPGGKEAEFRVSILPTLFGEKVVMRFLDKSALQVDMTQLGFERGSLEAVQDAVHKPYGMFLVTGPTGSGKTTTLYSAITELNEIGVNISTAEDPVEFSLTGVNQVHVQENIGLTFASALRSFLRQDPDIILVGEIRDLETAQIAVKAALTGHLVLSTLHTNDSPSTLTRLMNMGIEGFLIASSVNAIVAQRLARKLCPICKRPAKLDQDTLKRLGIDKDEAKDFDSYEPVGCKECNNTGYKGRTGIYEVLVMTPEMQEVVISEGTVMEIQKKAMEQGMQTMRQGAINKLKEGSIPIQEVFRVTV